MSKGARMMQRQGVQRCETQMDESGETSWQPVQLMQTDQHRKSQQSKQEKSTSRYLDVDKLYECKTETGHGDFVLDEDNPFHALGALFSDSGRGHHGL